MENTQISSQVGDASTEGGTTIDQGTILQAKGTSY